MNRRRLLRVWLPSLVATIALVVSGGSAWAYWSATNSAHPAQAKADTLPAGQTPSAAFTYPGGVTTATVTFSRLATTKGRTVSSFVISRYATATGGSPATTFSCNPGGNGATVSCIEAPVPAGTWYYTDTPAVANSNWVGAESARSAASSTDAVAPTVTYSQNPSANVNGYNNASVVVTLTAADAGSSVAFISYKLDAAATVQVNSTSAVFTVSGDGTHTVKFTATDNAGNQSTQQTQTIQIDSTPPATPVVSSYPNFINIANKSSISVNGTAEAGSTVTLTVGDGVPAHNIAQTTTATAGNWSFAAFDPHTLNDGTVTLNVTATDLAGNASTSPAQVTTTKDTVAPAAPVITTPAANGFINAATNGATFSVSGTKEANTSLVLTVSDGVPAHTITKSIALSASTSWSTTVDTTGLNQGSVTFSAAATDAANNQGSAANTSTTKDIAAPTVTVNQASGQADPTSATPINFTVAFSESVTGFSAAGVSRSGTSTGGTITVSGSGATYDVALTGSPTSGTVILAVTAGAASDAAGNGNTASTSSDNSVTYNVPPTVTNVTLANGSTAGKADKNDTVTITFSKQMNATTICSNWNNTGTQTLGGNGVVTATITDNGSNDLLTLSASSCTVNLGTIALGANYVNGTTTFNGSGSNATTITLTTGGVLTIMLGSGSGSATGVTAAVPSYTPAAGLTDTTGAPLAVTAYAGTSSRF